MIVNIHQKGQQQSHRKEKWRLNRHLERKMAWKRGNGNQEVVKWQNKARKNCLHQNLYQKFGGNQWGIQSGCLSESQGRWWDWKWMVSRKELKCGEFWRTMCDDCDESTADNIWAVFRITHLSRSIRDTKTATTASLSISWKIEVMVLFRSFRLLQSKSVSFSLRYPKRKKPLGARSGP
jgi:hypothetical protein